MIDFGFVVGAFIPYLMVVICTEKHLRLAWRLSLGLGVVPPLLLLYLRIKLQEPEEFKRFVFYVPYNPKMLTNLSESP
jgi:hypothetical protein